MNESSFDAQLRQFFEVMLTPAGIAGVIALAALIVSTLMSPRMKWVVIALLLWVATLSFFVEQGSRRAVILATPLNQIRSQARPICAALLMALFIPALSAPRGWRIRLLSATAIAFFLFELMLTLRMGLGGIISRALLSAFIYPLMFIPLAWGLGRWLQDWDNARTVIRAITAAGALFLVGTVYQLAVNRGAIVRGGRLLGTTGNPQQAGLMCAGVLPAVLYFVTRREEFKASRILYACLAGFIVIMLLWTGSRTGLLMGAVGVVVLFRARLGKMALVGIGVGLFAFLAFQLYSESTETIASMFQRGDNRTRVWSGMFAEFLHAPLWGTMQEQLGVGENSFLATAANTGLFGFLPLLLALFVAAFEFFRLQRVRSRLGSETLLVDVITASLAATFVGSFFEGFLLGTMTFQIICLYLYFGLMRFVLDAVKVSEANVAIDATMVHGDGTEAGSFGGGNGAAPGYPVAQGYYADQL